MFSGVFHVGVLLYVTHGGATQGCAMLCSVLYCAVQYMQYMYMAAMPPWCMMVIYGLKHVMAW